VDSLCKSLLLTLLLLLLNTLKNAANTLRNDEAHNSFFLASFADSTPSDVLTKVLENPAWLCI